MTNAKSYTLELRGSLGVRDAAGIAASLLAAIEAHPAVVIAAEGLTEIDVSILQVLVEDMEQELVPYNKRKACIRFAEWVMRQVYGKQIVRKLA